MRKIVLAAVGVTLALGFALAQAQQQVQAAGASSSRAQADVPARGLTMGQVEQRYGAPASRLAAVGQPPITRWVYPTFVVFFEHSLVIHAVASQGATPGN